mgnify:FL=1
MCVIEVIVIGISIKKCITNKQPLTMKNLKNIVVQSIVSTATSTLGGIHFISDSISDGCLNGEAWLRKKFDGIDPEETKNARIESTIRKQVSINDFLTRKKSRQELKETIVLQIKKQFTILPDEEATLEVQP